MYKVLTGANILLLQVDELICIILYLLSGKNVTLVLRIMTSVLAVHTYTAAS